MNISFNDLSIGLYTENMLKKQWGNVINIKGVAEGRCQIIDIDGEHALQITIKKRQLGPTFGGASWRYIFDKSYNEFTVEYKVRVSKEFNYVRGGKLPGLCGGSNPRGGMREKEASGFSARIMWRELGVLVQYVYFDELSERKHGKNFLWATNKRENPVITDEIWKLLQKSPAKIDGFQYLTPDIWHTIKTYVKMNTPGRDNGRIISWLDKRKVLDINISLRKDDSFAIDSFQFATYFGGNDETWVPEKDEKIYFKDFNFLN